MASSLLLGAEKAGHKVVGVLRWQGENKNPIIRSIQDFFFLDKFYTLVKAAKAVDIKAKSANSKEFMRQALRLEPDVILVGSWGEKIKKPTILLPKIASINCHPSLLPAHRGANPYASAIRAGETKTGVTFHLIDENIDTGAILLQKELKINDYDTGGDVKVKCSYLAETSVKELLEGIENGTIKPEDQYEPHSSYFPQLTDDDAIIDWMKPATEIHDQIRGLNPWIKCYFNHKGNFLFIGKSKVVKLENPENNFGKILKKGKNSLLISTGDPYSAILVENLKLYGFFEGFLTNKYIISKIKIGDCVV